MTDKEERKEELDLIEQYVEVQGVTKCPPAYVAPINGGEDLGKLPHYDDEHKPSVRQAIQGLYSEYHHNLRVMRRRGLYKSKVINGRKVFERSTLKK
ncbi:hypothetical protein LCGC14_0231550 [marine sediment metagenome]|uniref:Uncharacterized protein n=1 Tax=marine sediment metagenome TaxID=412755 RepID=A0A0F9URB3_9ZZZZ